jgi:hypothetical protein
MEGLCVFYKVNSSPRSGQIKILIYLCCLTDITYIGVFGFSSIILSPCLARASITITMRLVREIIDSWSMCPLVIHTPSTDQVVSMNVFQKSLCYMVIGCKQGD